MNFPIFEGIVKHGNQIGRTIGFPTLNLYPIENNKLDCGVYTCIVKIDEQTYYGVMNLGFRLTFEGQTLRLEIHVLDFNQDCYGKKIQVIPVTFIRLEKKFSSKEALQMQIHQDVQLAKLLFNK